VGSNAAVPRLAKEHGTPLEMETPREAFQNPILLIFHRPSFRPFFVYQSALIGVKVGPFLRQILRGAKMAVTGAKRERQGRRSQCTPPG